MKCKCLNKIIKLMPYKTISLCNLVLLEIYSFETQSMDIKPFYSEVKRIWFTACTTLWEMKELRNYMINAEWRRLREKDNNLNCKFSILNNKISKLFWWKIESYTLLLSTTQLYSHNSCNLKACLAIDPHIRKKVNCKCPPRPRNKTRRDSLNQWGTHHRGVRMRGR